MRGNDYCIDTNKLCVGQVFDNYSSLCNALGVEEKIGSSKQFQVKKFQEYFSFEKFGWKYRITEIYGSPKTVAPQRGRKSVFIPHIEPILIDLLSRCENMESSMKEHNWEMNIGFFNEKFDKMDKSEIQAIDKNLTDYDINIFRYKTPILANLIFTSAINSMEKRGIIKSSKATYVNKSVDGGLNKRVATDKEIEIIKNVQNKIALDLECKNANEARFSPKKRIQFNNGVYNELKKGYSIYGYCRRLEISLCDNNITILSDQELIDHKRELNQLFIKKIITDAKKGLEKQIQKYNETMAPTQWGEPDTIRDRDAGIFLFPDNFIETRQTLCRILIENKF